MKLRILTKFPEVLLLNITAKTLLLLFVFTFPGRALAQTVVVDNDFNADVNSSVYAIATQSNGRTLIGGRFSEVNGRTYRNIARLYSDGTSDILFNPNPNDWVRAIAIQADGKIVIGGEFTTVRGETRNHIARISPNGTLDFDFDPDLDGRVSDIAIQSDGKILIAGGFNTVGGTSRNGLARLNPSGTLDTGINLNLNISVTTSVAIQANNKILTGGSFNSVGGVSRQSLVRSNFNGTLDTGFNANLESPSTVNSIAIQDDGKILIAGTFTEVGGASRNLVARLNSNGTLDTGFDPNVSGPAFSSVGSIILLPNNKILIGGSFTNVGGGTRNYLARLNENGALDMSFNITPNDMVATLTMGDGDEILMGGDFTTISGVTRNRVARLKIQNEDMCFPIVAQSGGIVVICI